MNWFDLLKVDIDFDKDIEAFGQYAEGIDISNEKELDNFMTKLMMIGAFTGKPPDIKEFVKENIKINHARIHDYLKQKLERKPTEEELITFITRTIMHEGTHAAMREEQDSMAEHQAEYGAFTGQFPESTFLRLKQFVLHPATKRVLFPPQLLAMIGIDPNSAMRTPDIIEKVQELIAYIEGITEEIPKGKQKDEFQERLARLEMTSKTKGEPIPRFWDNMSPKEYYEFSLRRYGNENKDLVDALARANGLEPSELKAAMAVTTTTAPSMFNRKVIRRKKRRDD